jgi:hypothetical protein
MKNKRRKDRYTVIGYRESNGESLAYHISATTPWEAMAQAAAGFGDDESGDVVIVGAVRGYHDLIPPCESGNTAFACDMPMEDEESETE